jgi:ribosomal protein L37E
MESIPCPRCGHQVLSTDVYCSECGYSVTEADRKAAARLAAETRKRDKTEPSKKSSPEYISRESGDPQRDELEDVAEQILSGSADKVKPSPGPSSFDFPDEKEELHAPVPDLLETPAEPEELSPSDESLSMDETMSLEEEEILDEEVMSGELDENLLGSDELTMEDEVIEPVQDQPRTSPSVIADDVDQMINDALMTGGQLLGDKLYQDAVKTFSKAIGAAIKNGLEQQEDRRLITLYLRRGEAFRQLGDVERTKDNYSRALKYAQSIFAANDVERIRDLMTRLP